MNPKPRSAFAAQRAYGDVSHRVITGLAADTLNLTPMLGAHLHAGAVLQHADVQETRIYGGALRSRQNE